MSRECESRRVVANESLYKQTAQEKKEQFPQLSEFINSYKTGE